MGQVRATQQACLSHKKREAARQRVKHWRALAKLIHPLHVHISVMCSAFNPSIPGRHELFRPAFVPPVREREEASTRSGSTSRQRASGGKAVSEFHCGPQRQRARESMPARARASRSGRLAPLHWGLARPVGRPSGTACHLFRMMREIPDPESPAFFFRPVRISQQLCLCLTLVQKVDSVDFEKSTNLTFVSTWLTFGF